MSIEEVQIFEKSRRSKFLELIILMVGLVCFSLIAFDTSNLKISNVLGFWIFYLGLTILHFLSNLNNKIIISSEKVIIKNGLRSRMISVDAIRVVEMVCKKGLKPYLVLKTDRSTIRAGHELERVQIIDSVVCIFEKIRQRYPENLAKVNQGESQKEQMAVEEFWSK